MTRRWFTLTLAIVVASLHAPSVSSQTPKSQKDVEQKLAEARRMQAMEEHIEVFRRLLGRSLTETVMAQGSATECPALHASGRFITQLPSRYGVHSVKKEVHDLGPVEGVYLKGHGVVYSITLPPPLNDPLARSSTSAKPASTPWERELNELRGVKPESKTETPAAPPSLTDTLVRLLAENGKHFSELPEGENLSVAVVFRSGASGFGSACTSCHQVDKVNANVVIPFHPAASGSQPPRMVPKVSEQHSELVEQIREGVTLGDLHARQGKYEEATREYLKIEPMVAKLITMHKANPDQFTVANRMQAVMLSREVCGKLAQAFLAQGQQDSAMTVLRTDMQLGQWLESTIQGKASTTSATPVSVPTRLTVTAPKKALDQVGSGKMSLEEFRKLLTIESTVPVKTGTSGQ